MNKKFKIGDKIRCIDTNWVGVIREGKIYPVYQGIYTVHKYTNSEQDGIFLKEIFQEKLGGYFSWHFEKATELNTETAMIAKKKIEEFQLN